MGVNGPLSSNLSSDPAGGKKKKEKVTGKTNLSQGKRNHVFSVLRMPL